MKTRMFAFSDPKATGKLRFQDLPDEIQDRIIDAFEKGRPPEFEYPGLTHEVLAQWYADMNIFKFWVKHRDLRGVQKRGSEVKPGPSGQ